MKFDAQKVNRLVYRSIAYGLVSGLVLFAAVTYQNESVLADEIPTPVTSPSDVSAGDATALGEQGAEPMDSSAEIQSDVSAENATSLGEQGTEATDSFVGNQDETARESINQELAKPTINETLATGPESVKEEGSSQLPSVTMYKEGVKTDGAIEDDQIRQSSHYTAAVMTDENGAHKQESFVHMSVPRSGLGKQGYDKEDGAEFAANHGMTQSWTSFTYSTDTWVEIGLIDGVSIDSIDDVSITPQKYAKFDKKMIDPHTIAVKVPYLDSGVRLSVEVKGQMMDVYAHDGTWGAQDQNKDGADKLVSTEPRHSMIIVANPALDPADIPTAADGKIQYMEPGRWQDVKDDTDILVIKSGLHYMTNHAIAKLDHVKWIYFEDGAYVKGAFDFQSNPDIHKISGYGVLSPEQYGYEMSSKTFAYNTAGNEGGGWVDNIKALRFWATDRIMDIVGLTIANPTYHTMVAYGDEDHFKTNFTRFNQFGAWYWQTDAPEVYGGGTMKDSFIMSNDDTFKLYHSNSTYDNIVVWKEENGPVFQWGWTGRNISNINVSNVSVIHSRMHWNNDNTGLFNSASNLGDGRYGDQFTIDNLNFKNIRFEDRLNTLFRLHENGNLKNVTVDGLYIKDWTETNNDGGTSSTISHMGSGVLENLTIANYFVKGEPITFENRNWESNQLGRLNFDVKYWGNWTLVGGGLSDEEALKAEQESFVYKTPFIEPKMPDQHHFNDNEPEGSLPTVDGQKQIHTNESPKLHLISSARTGLDTAAHRAQKELPETGDTATSSLFILGLVGLLLGWFLSIGKFFSKKGD